MSKEFKLNLEGLDCANCANKIENRVNKLEEVEEASVNFSLGRINIKIENENNKDNVIDKVIKIVKE
uniref:cation transporter n=1 Tax=uncultured Clostridium sp. TaxID=59620 RepID=UPI0025F3BEB3